MSPEGALHAALNDALSGVAGLNRSTPGPPLKASPPVAEIGALIGSEWGTKDRAGREIRASVTIRDLAEQAERLHAIGAAVAEAVAALPRAFGGWRIASCVRAKSRIGSEKAGSWVAVLEWRIRLLETGEG